MKHGCKMWQLKLCENKLKNAQGSRERAMLGIILKRQKSI